MKFELKRFIRYIVFVVLLVMMLMYRENLVEEVSFTFDFSVLNRIEFVIFTVIGGLIALLPHDVLRKDTWSVHLKLELIPLVIIFFWIGSLYLFNWSYVFEFINFLQVSVGLLLLFSQMLFGYTVMQFFLKD